MANSAMSRRMSEVYGVALWAFALIWLIALVTRSPADPVWFFNSLPSVAPANFAGRFGAFLAEASLQLMGYTAFLIPAVLSVIGWHAFWCRPLEARYTKITGVTLLVLQPIAADGTAFGRTLVAVDSVGAGPGETVFFVRGKEASFPFHPGHVPADAGIVGILDHWTLGE